MAESGTGRKGKGGATLARRFEGEWLFLKQAASRDWEHLAGIHTPEGTDQGPKSYPTLSLLMAHDPKWQAQPTEPFGGKGARREPGQGLKWAWMAGGTKQVPGHAPATWVSTRASVDM